MNALTRVGAFATALVALSGTAAAVGAAVGPLGSPAPREHQGHPTGGEHLDGHRPDGDGGTPAGLQVSEDGYTLDLLQETYAGSASARVRFRILDEHGAAVTGFRPLHGKRLHLIVVRRELDSFQHVHPVMAEDGTWSVDVDLAEPGAYRVFADFQPSGAERGLTLGHDLTVPGEYVARALPEAATTATVDDYDVRLEGLLLPGRTSRLTLTVTRNGRPVTDLQPYLEAFGHLVALRDGDLAYLHVHPDGAPGDGRTAPGPGITFFAEVPSAGSYRLFLDFKHGDRVRTAAFTVVADPPGGEHAH